MAKRSVRRAMRSAPATAAAQPQDPRASDPAPDPDSAQPGTTPAFSLVLGGPLFQLLRRGRLSDDFLGLARRRVAVVALIGWAPLLALSTLQGPPRGAADSMAFLDDVECHLRFLVVVPLLIFAELFAHRRLQPLIDQFEARLLVRSEQSARFASAICEASKLRNAVAAEALMFALVYGAGVPLLWRHHVALQTASWYAPTPGGGSLSPAGLWFVFVSLPLFQFLLLRWYFRLFIWAKFLWRVSQLDLDLDAAHPDKAGGLGFLSESLFAFLPIAVAHGTLLAGMIADRASWGGAKLADFRAVEFTGVILLLAMFAGPLTVFAPLLGRVRREGLHAYGALGQAGVRRLRDRRQRGVAPAEQSLIAKDDLEYLAHLASSFAHAEQMRVAPISRTAVAVFVAAVLAPLLPVMLTLAEAERLARQLVGLAM